MTVPTASPRIVRVETGGSVDLGGGRSMVFVSHGHKAVFPDQESPLLVMVSYRDGEKALETQVYSLFPPADDRWRWRDVQVRVVEYEYGRSMVLEIATAAGG